MIDKADAKVPFSAGFRPEFKFVLGELKYAGFSSSVRPSKYYSGTCDLRPFHLDALLHIHYKGRGPKNHKLEIIDAGEKSLDQMGKIITAVFDVNLDSLGMMRIDFAADLPGVPVVALYKSLRVKFKRSSDERGELDYETVGSRRLEYFRYGKSPNCVRTYDKPAECKARFPLILKHAHRDAEPPTFEDHFGFPENAIMTRVERQARGGRSSEGARHVWTAQVCCGLQSLSKLGVSSTGVPTARPEGSRSFKSRQANRHPAVNRDTRISADSRNAQYTRERQTHNRRLRSLCEGSRSAHRSNRELVD